MAIDTRSDADGVPAAGEERVYVDRFYDSPPARLGTPPAKPEDPLVMPGSSKQVAREIAHVGVEGQPADAKAGPRLLRMELLVIALAVVAVAIGLGFWLGWFAGLSFLGFGVLAMLVNPVFGATLDRAHDRELVANHHAEHPKPL